MFRLSLAKLAAGFGTIAFALTAATGVASADPMDAAINTTCNYGQVMAALNATDPGAAAQINGNPFARNKLQTFLNSGPDGRRQIANELSSSPFAARYMNELNVVAQSCNNY